MVSPTAVKGKTKRKNKTKNQNKTNNKQNIAARTVTDKKTGRKYTAT